MEEPTRALSFGTVDSFRDVVSVQPQHHCERFVMRRGGFPLAGECWYCRYAYFGLERARPMKRGECRWPETQVK